MSLPCKYGLSQQSMADMTDNTRRTAAPAQTETYAPEPPQPVLNYSAEAAGHSRDPIYEAATIRSRTCLWRELLPGNAIHAAAPGGRRVTRELRAPPNGGSRDNPPVASIFKSVLTSG